MERLTELWIMPRELATGKGTALAEQLALGLLPMGKLDTVGIGSHGTPMLEWYL